MEIARPGAADPLHRQFEVRRSDSSLTVRVDAADELAAAEASDVGSEAFVYPAELPVGWEGVDPEDPA